MVEILLVGIGIAGVVVYFSNEVCLLFCSFRSRMYVYRNLKSISSTNYYNRGGKICRHLYKVIEGAELMSFYKSVGQFIGISLTMLISSFSLLVGFLDIGIVVFSSVFLAMIPYFICILRLKGRRSSGSREGDILVYELLNNYRICNYNMKSAIEACALSIEGAPISKNVLMNLSKNLNLAATESEINSAMEIFKYAFDTAWGNILASNMFLAIYRGVNVEKSLEILSTGISKGRQVIEYERRQNFEASLMLKFLAPICYFLSLVASLLFFDISISEYVYYQFGTPLGLKWFIIMIAVYFVAFCVARMASSEKMDI